MLNIASRMIAVVGIAFSLTAITAHSPASAAAASQSRPAGQASAGRLDYSLLSCHQYIPYYEQALRIPSRLLESIALTESSRKYPGTKMTVAWPWTVMAEGRGRYFNSRAEAIKEVVGLQKRGIRNIDVGCMQVNLRAHPEAFDSLEQAFDPAYNVRYAAQFLTRLRNRHSSWVKAVGFYHSGTPDLHKRYRDKVLAKWRDNFATGSRSPVFAYPAGQQSPQYAAARGMTGAQVYQNLYASRAAGRPVASSVGQGGKVFYVRQNAAKGSGAAQRSLLAMQQRDQFLAQRRQGRMQILQYR